MKALSTRTLFHLMVPYGAVPPLSPGMKSRADTYCRLSLMSNTQCAAVTTWLRPSSVPEHCRPLHHLGFRVQGRSV